MIDLSPSQREHKSEAIVELIDIAVKDHYDGRPPRMYLGGSRLGEECKRKLFYEYHNTPKDPDKGFSGQTYRIFDMGHDGEERVAEYLGLAGFELLTENKFGDQFGFEIEDGKIAGHADGVITVSPTHEVPVPCLWENKALGAKSWKDTVKHGCKKSKPVYYAQCQVYMHQLGLSWALFTCINRDTGQLYFEVIDYNPNDAEKYLLDGKMVVGAEFASELVPISTDPSFYLCKWCDYQSTCQAEPDVAQVAPKTKTPDWVFNT